MNIYVKQSAAMMITPYVVIGALRSVDSDDNSDNNVVVPRDCLFGLTVCLCFPAASPFSSNLCNFIINGIIGGCPTSRYLSTF